MKSFLEYLIESEEKHGVLSFGRMNPPTIGHEKLINKVHEVAKKHNAEHHVVLSASQDSKKNPLSAEQKVKHAKRAFPGTNIKAASKDQPTIMHHAAELHKAGVEHLHVVAGSDRKQEYHDLLHKYNGQTQKHGHYNFKSITVHSSGERDPDAEGAEGMSASKMREHAHAGNKAAFHSGTPSKMSKEHKDELYHDVRKGLGHLNEDSNEHYQRAEVNKASADAAMKQGDKLAYHLHMADHHDDLAEWHHSKGRSSLGDQHAEKAQEHADLADELIRKKK